MGSWGREGGRPYVGEPFRVVAQESVPTTNDEVKAAIRAGEPEGLMYSALEQTAGYGRQGRRWVSPYGGLYSSFLLRPRVSPDELSTVALVAALAVRDTLLAVVRQTSPKDKRLARAAEAAIQVKWPNDMVYARGKLCGISSEFVSGALCLGIGVNVFEPADHIDVGGKNAPAYLSDFLPNGRERVAPNGLSAGQRQVLETVRSCLARAVQARYASWLAGGFAVCAEEFRDHMSLYGELVEVVTRTGEPIAQGEVIGVGDDGTLLVRDVLGEIREVASGEAHIL